MPDFRLTWDNERILARVRTAAAEGLTKGMDVVRVVSQSNTPVEYGNLKASQVVIPATPENLVATLHTDDTITTGPGKHPLVSEYAVYVHEILTNKHSVGGAKFMENAVDTAGDKAIGILASRIAKML